MFWFSFKLDIKLEIETKNLILNIFFCGHLIWDLKLRNFNLLIKKNLNLNNNADGNWTGELSTGKITIFIWDFKSALL